MDAGEQPQQVGPGSEGDGYRLLSDQRNVTNQDPLGFDRIAAELSGMILGARSSSPFTLGVEGGWGTGKSSLMDRIESRLKESPGVSTVWFEAWTADEGQALESLIKSALSGLDPNTLRSLAQRRRLRGWARLATTLAGGWLHVGTLVDAIWDELSVDPMARNQLRDLLDQEMQSWISGDPTLPDGRLLAVFIDDLDRCSPTNVFQIFEAIKLYLDTPGFVFVIGYDKAIVSEAVLSKKRYGSSVKSADYLEKIIQISYRMPRPSEDSALDLIDTYLDESRTRDLFKDSPLKSLVIERSASNPRRIKRFINSFILEYSLDHEWQEFTPADVIRVVVLYMYFAEFAELLHAPGRDDDDPIEKFLSYVEVRQALDQRPAPDNENAWSPIVEFARKYELPRVEPDQGAGHASEELARRLPACFSALAEHDEFAEFLKSFGEQADRKRLRTKLQRRRPSVNVESPSGQAPAPRTAPSRSVRRALPSPTGSHPYHVRLEDHLSSEQNAALQSGGALVFHAAGSTGGVKEPFPQLRVAAAMQEDVTKSGTAFFYHLGDVVYYNGRAEDYYAQFYEPYRSYPAPIFAIPGNHDGDNSDDPATPSLSAFVANFCASVPGISPHAGGIERLTMTQPNVYWTLRAGLVTIIGLYTNVPEGGRVDKDQARWLVNELKAAPPDRALLVALHHDPYSLAGSGGSARMGALLDDAFEESGRIPDLVLSAHAHSYQRYTRKFRGRVLPYITAGASGYPRLNNLRQPLVQLPTAITDDCTLEVYANQVHGFLRLTATSTQLVGEYVGVSGDGSVIDPLDSFALDLGASATEDASTAVPSTRAGSGVG